MAPGVGPRNPCLKRLCAAAARDQCHLAPLGGGEMAGGALLAAEPARHREGTRLDGRVGIVAEDRFVDQKRLRQPPLTLVQLGAVHAHDGGTRIEGLGGLDIGPRRARDETG